MAKSGVKGGMLKKHLQNVCAIYPKAHKNIDSLWNYILK
jgi:hypothetical protein